MKYLNHSMKTKGFTLIELLCSLMIISLSILLLTSALTLLPHCIVSEETIQDEIALAQLRHMVLLGEDITVSFNILEMRYLNHPVIIHQDRQRLVKEDGYEILMQNIQSIEFTQEGKCFYLTYEKLQQSEAKKRFITCE